VLGALSLVLNGGSLEQIQTINRELVAALEGREDRVKSVLNELNTFVGGLDAQKQQIVRALDSMDRLTARLVDERQVIATALEDIPAGNRCSPSSARSWSASQVAGPPRRRRVGINESKATRSRPARAAADPHRAANAGKASRTRSSCCSATRSRDGDRGIAATTPTCSSPRTSTCASWPRPRASRCRATSLAPPPVAGLPPPGARTAARPRRPRRAGTTPRPSPLPLAARPPAAGRHGTARRCSTAAPSVCSTC
jgi:hypothetical protein